MSTISFNLSQKSRVDAARVRWQRSLQKDLGQVGMPVVVWVEHPVIGEEQVVEVNQGFVDFLRQESVHFEIRHELAVPPAIDRD